MLCCFLVVACNEETNSNKQIHSYTIEAQKNQLEADIHGSINEKNRFITLDAKVPVNKDLIATFDATGEVFIGTIPQISGETSNNYASQLQYTVKAEDGSSATYTILSEPLQLNTITDFSIRIIQHETPQKIQGVIDDKSSTITLKVPSNDWIDDVEKAIATFTSEGLVKIGDVKQISGTTPNDYRNELIYTVTAEDDSQKEYTVRLVVPQSTGLPVIKIDTKNNAVIRDKENYVTAIFTLSDGASPENDLKEKATGIRGRGNTTWGYPKKPYRLKFDKKVSIFGLGEAKSWVLLANYLDPTFIMNTVTFEIGHRVGLPYTNHAHHVEFFLNGIYQGSYVFTEQVQADKQRVNIDEDDDFLIELDSYYDELIKFKTPFLKLPVNVKSPEPEAKEDENRIRQLAQDFINELEEAMFGTTSNFPENKHYKELIDINTLVDFLLVNEIVRNDELKHPKSTYLYKKKEGKIQMGPLWDFDWGFGSGGDNQDYFHSSKSMLFYNGNTSSDIGIR
ncbi:hypothetical protein EZS27_027170, partial [termite gut metagenome]